MLHLRKHEATKDEGIPQKFEPLKTSGTTWYTGLRLSINMMYNDSIAWVGVRWDRTGWDGTDGWMDGWVEG